MVSSTNVTQLKSLLLIISLFLFVPSVHCEVNSPATVSFFYKNLTPKEETFFVSGIQWGAPQNFNPLAVNSAFPVTFRHNVEMVYETLFMYNQLNNSLVPLIANKLSWIDPYTLKVDLNENVRFHDGVQLTSEDVVYSFELGKRYDIDWSNYWNSFVNVKTDGKYGVVITLDQKSYNKLAATESVSTIPILPKHVWSEIEKDSNYKLERIRKRFNANPVGTGPYRIYYYDQFRVVSKRYDDYWGQSLYNKLPTPKYIVHKIYYNNEDGVDAFLNGKIDYTMLFIKDFKELAKHKNIKTYLKNPPYQIPGVMPTLFLNNTIPGLNNSSVRRAIAMSIDFQKIADKAMSGYSVKMEQHLALPTREEAEFIDKDSLQIFRWEAGISHANALLDQIGAYRGTDGIRVLNGERLGPWEIRSPAGWTDWEAAIEIVAESMRQIGIDARAKYMKTAAYIRDMNNGEFQICMWTPAESIISSQIWLRSKFIMYSKGVPPVGVGDAYWNYGRYRNERADEILEAIPLANDADELRALYTELNMIWLRDVPAIPLMYRPREFYTVNDSRWKGFPIEGDDSNIPPQLFGGAGIMSLYRLKFENNE